MSTLTYTISQAALLTGLSKTSVREMTKNGEIPVVREKDGIIRLNESAIALLVSARRRQWVCIVPDIVSDDSVNSWLKPLKPPLANIVRFNPLAHEMDIQSVLSSATQSKIGKVFVFNSNTLSRESLNLVIAAASRSQADLTFVNSTSLS